MILKLLLARLVSSSETLKHETYMKIEIKSNKGKFQKVSISINVEFQTKILNFQFVRVYFAPYANTHRGGSSTGFCEGPFEEKWGFQGKASRKIFVTMLFIISFTNWHYTVQKPTGHHLGK